MNIFPATSDAQILSCYPVLKELRPDLEKADFLEQVRRLESKGYRLAYLEEGDMPVAVAGFRLGESLAWGRYLYVDDLVTLAAHRSKGYGSKLLAWLTDYAANEGCGQLHLDSGVQRVDAHRFYERQGMTMASYHYAIKAPLNTNIQQ